MAEVKKVIRGTFGEVWMNYEKLSNCKSVEIKTTFEYDDIDVPNNLTAIRQLKGVSHEGTLTLYKINSKVQQLLIKAIKNKEMPEIKLIVKLSDPNFKGSETVEVTGVTFDDFTIASFELKRLEEESLQFKCTEINAIEYFAD